MAVHFHKLKVKKVTRETADCISVLFDVPPQLEAEFSYLQGQNITLKKEIDGEEIRRSYSLCTAPFEKALKVAIKRVEGGKFSGYANEMLKAGDELEVLPPTGKFHSPLDAQNKKNYLAFAAGSGITPVISIIKATLQAEPESHFTLVYGNRSRASIIFFEELEGLKNKYLNRFSLVHLLSREVPDSPLNYGKINDEKLGELAKMTDFSKIDDFFVCGPESMIFCVTGYLENKGIEKRRIHFELFNTPGPQQQTGGPENAGENEAAASSAVTVILDGRSFGFELPFSSKTSILDAALKQGADLPFACKGGVCCTCKAKLLEGKVKMDVNWSLEPDELEQGYILSCQSHPITEKVVVDFDVK